jgi:hypothetical protein
LAPLNTTLSSGSELAKRASLAFIGRFVVIFTSETTFTCRRTGKGVTSVWAGCAIIAGPNGKSIFRADLNIGVIIRGLVAGRGSLAEWRAILIAVLPLVIALLAHEAVIGVGRWCALRT